MSSGDGKSTVVERPISTKPARDRDDDEPAPRSSRRSIPPGMRYESGDEIGRGGMGRVVEATDTLLERTVAVKEALTTDPELLRRFARETKITARLEHPSIVPVYDAGSVDGAPYYVMRRVTGRPLSDLIRAAPSLNERLALVPHLLAAAQAIAHAHQRGIIHRDIKPSNILVGELGETVVIDWGLAKVIGEPDEDTGDTEQPGAEASLRTRLGAVFGTPGFMAPDQLRGDPVGPQGDVYSLGASLYNLLAAEPPHYASDSTQMMKLATLGPPVPISERVSGVPAELSTIVDRATDYDVTRRYKDAGAFAEDLKRFLAGQLVASHRYTRTERFARFVRKHRAALAVGTAALVLVTVIGAFAVSQVVEERDRADDQARLATQGRHEAEAARAMADDRADQLLISRASALLDTNPTHAIASLKQLSPKSKRIDEARAIISAARIRGIAWAMPGSDTHTSYATLDQSAVRLAQMTTDGKLHVYDLDARRIAFEADVGRAAQIRWVRDGKLLLVSFGDKTRMFDARGVERPSDVPAFSYISTDERGLQLVHLDLQGTARWIDLEAGTTTVLGQGVTDASISPDGTRCAITTDRELVVMDRAGKPLLRRAHAKTIVRTVLAATKIAIMDNGRILEAPLEPGATWRELVLPTTAGYLPYWIDYLGDRLFATYTDGRIATEGKPGLLREIGRMDHGAGGMTRFAHDYLSLGADGRQIHYTDGWRVRTLYLPIALTFVRVVSRSTQPRLVAVGDGAIVVIDLESLPELVPVPRYQVSLFVDEHTLISSNSFVADHVWYGLQTGQSVLTTANKHATLRSLDRSHRRVAIIEMQASGRRGLVFKSGERAPSDVVEEPFHELQLVGDSVVYSYNDKVFGGPSAAERRALVKTNGDVRIVVRIDGTHFAAVTDLELVRGDLKTGAIERVPLPPGAPVVYGIGHRGDLVIARGDRIVRWHGNTLTEIATFEAVVEQVFAFEHGLLALTADGSTIFIANDGTRTRLASTRGNVLLGTDRVIVPGQFQYDVIELPSLARWSLPVTRSSDFTDIQIDLSPSGTQLIEKGGDGRLWLWKLPISADFTSALMATNLVEDQHGLLLWPWQAADPQK